MKKLNMYFPIWVLIMVPPMIFLTLVFNFAMVAIATVGVFLLIKKEGIFKTFLPSIFKLWGVTLLLDVITFILFILPQVLYSIPFINDNLVAALETNPYSNIYSIIYIVFIVFINILLIINFCKKIILKKHKLDSKTRLLAILIFVIFMLPYLFFIPSNKVIKTNYNSLEEYRGTTMKNKSKVATILKYLEISDNISSYILDTHVEPYTLYIYVNDIEIGHQKMFEMDAAILFNLVDDVNEIFFNYNDKNYKYTINSINSIYKNVKKLDLNQIYERYNDNKFSDYIYLGRIDDYDIFDTSETCELEHQLLFEVFATKYYLSCSSVEQIILYNDDSTINIKEALESNLITEYDIVNSNIDLITESEIDFENIS